MGCCFSSTEYVIDPVTGEEKKKNSLGGAYPGRRRPQQAPYAPPTLGGGKTAPHFKAYGGGNALTLVQDDGTSTPETGKPRPQYVQVTLPVGVEPGQTIHVQAPDGKLNAVIIPPGFGAGSTFTVEFEADAPKKQHAPVSQPPPPRPDDGFATGFGNPDFTATGFASNQPEVAATSAPYDATSYPTTTYQPVYTSTPVYPSK